MFSTVAARKRTADRTGTSHILRLSPKTLYSYAERDLIPHFKIETSIRFSGTEVAEWLRSRRHSAHQQLRTLSMRAHG